MYAPNNLIRGDSTTALASALQAIDFDPASGALRRPAHVLVVAEARRTAAPDRLYRPTLDQRFGLGGAMMQ